MIGIDLDKLSLAINKEISIVENIDDFTLDLRSIIGSLSDTYSGMTLNFLAATLNKQSNNIEKIRTLHKSYLLMLQTVKKSYVAQDEIFYQQLNNKL